MHAFESKRPAAVLIGPFYDCPGYSAKLPLRPLGMECAVVGGWKFWVAIAFVLMALIVSAPFVPRWLWITGSVAVVVAGLVLLVVAIKRRNAKVAEAVGLLPALSNDPPSDLDGP